MENFNDEYYVMKTDGANNHPILAWGKTSMMPFLDPEEIDTENLNLPLEVVFSTPYPPKPEMADILYIMESAVLSEKIKLLFEKLTYPKVQFIPITILTNNKEKIDKGYYIFHCWNGIPAIDKNDYDGDPVDEDGEIVSLKRFSLDPEVLSEIEQKDRLIFRCNYSVIIFQRY